MFIYKITNLVNNKMYIGQTTQKKPISRFDRHICNAKYNIKGPLYNAIRKYGKENFRFEVIFSAFSLADLNDSERYFISLFQSNKKKFGYNISLGGASRLTKESINKMKKTIQKQFDDGRTPWNKGKGNPIIISEDKRHTEEYRRNLSLSKIEYYKHNRQVLSKFVYCVELNIFFNSASQAGYFFNTTQHCISRVCRGERSYHKNLTFKYVDNIDENNLIYIIKESNG